MISYLDRINELAYKAKTDGLTASELKEQKTLRQQYVAEIRGQVLASISNVKVIDPTGQDVTPAILAKRQLPLS